MAVETLEKLKTAVLEYDGEQASDLARKVLEEDIDPIEAIDALTEAIRLVGDGFGRGELWLPELVGAASAMKSAMPILEDAIQREGKKREAVGTVVIGTVFGDIHDIGKNMVSTLLTADGFIVHDLGINIAAEEFVQAIKRYKPDILAMSALMTMTAPELGKVINSLKEEGLRNQVKVMVGGAAITREFARKIGADGYEPTVRGAVELAKRLSTRTERL